MANPENKEQKPPTPARRPGPFMIQGATAGRLPQRGDPMNMFSSTPFSGGAAKPPPPPPPAPTARIRAVPRMGQISMEPGSAAFELQEARTRATKVAANYERLAAQLGVAAAAEAVREATESLDRAEARYAREVGR